MPGAMAGFAALAVLSLRGWRSWLGFHVTAGFTAVLTTIVGSAAGANLSRQDGCGPAPGHHTSMRRTAERRR